jgi:hypothetical protein
VLATSWAALSSVSSPSQMVVSYLGEIVLLLDCFLDMHATMTSSHSCPHAPSFPCVSASWALHTLNLQLHALQHNISARSWLMTSQCSSLLLFTLTLQSSPLLVRA